MTFEMTPKQRESFFILIGMASKFLDKYDNDMLKDSELFNDPFIDEKEKECGFNINQAMKLLKNRLLDNDICNIALAKEKKEIK